MNNILTTAELESSLISKVEWLKKEGINNVVVIPAIKEYQNIKLLLKSLLLLDDFYLHETVFLFVINNSDNTTQEIREDNSKSLQFLREIICKKTADSFAQQIINSKLILALVDAASPGKEIPDKIAGVGAARKTGMDLSLTLFDYKNSSKKIIICLDADCTVDRNYLTVIKKSFTGNNIDVAVIDYQHKIFSEFDNEKAITWYEIFLRYYSFGLAYANSPYSFHTIGSTIVCTDNAYKKVGGMNTKEAAEDFYFLQKLAKQFRVYRTYKTIVYPSARESWRVPFGTGRSISDFTRSIKNNFLLYDPNIFEILKDWLQLFQESGFESPQNLFVKTNSIHPGLSKFLEQRKFESSWQNILDNSKTIGQLNKQKNNWFDAFKTLKLVHYLRDNYFPSINMFEAIDYFVDKLNYPSILHNEDKPDLIIQKEYLEFLKEAEKNLLLQFNKNLVIG